MLENRVEGLRRMRVTALFALLAWSLLALSAPAEASSLRKAAKRGNLDDVRRLISEGADVDDRDSRGNTPIYYAAVEGHASVVEALARADADIDVTNSFGSTPLHVASRRGHCDVIRVLAAHGADLNVSNLPGGNRNVRGDAFSGAALPGLKRGTPLEKAARSGKFEAVKCLVEVGVALPAREAVNQAQLKGHTEIAEFITRATSERREQERRKAATGGPPDPIEFTSSYGRRVAVVIGISKYSRLSNLEGAARDASEIAELLRVLGFDEVLELYDQDATRARVLDLLGRKLQEKTTTEDLAFVFFAGHGATETLPNGEKRGYLVPTNGGFDDAYATGISMETLRDLSNRLAAKHVYYAIDACYSGSLAVSRGQGQPDTAGVRKQAVQVLTAGVEGQQALEEGGRGVFTTYLVQGLKGEANRNNDGVITASEIAWFVTSQVQQSTKNRQTPFFGRLSGTGEIAFPLPPAKPGPS